MRRLAPEFLRATRQARAAASSLRALPVRRLEKRRVNIDYHAEFDHHWYSVPYQLTQQEVELRATATTVEIFHKGLRVASHARSYALHCATTVEEHRPKAHQRYLAWTPSGSSIGPRPSARRRPNCSSASCRPSATPSRAIAGVSVFYGSATNTQTTRRGRGPPRPYAQRLLLQSLKSILKNNLDGTEPESAPAPKPPLDHPNLRGPNYFDTGDSPALQ